MRRISIIGLSLVLAGSVLVAGCTKGDSDATTSTGASQHLELNLTSGEPASLDPAKAFDGNSMEVVNNLFEGLMRFDKNHQPKLATAKKIEKSKDGLTYTFTLQDNAKWSNGEPVTAKDFEVAWKRVMDPKTASNASLLMNPIKNAKAYYEGKAKAEDVGVQAKDEKTLVVELEQPTPYFEQLIAYTPFSPVYSKGIENKKNPFGEAKEYISNGPFKMKSWKHDNRIVAVKNEEYRDAKKVKLAQIDWGMTKDRATLYQQYKAGEIDYLDSTSIPPDLQGKEIEKGEAKVSDGGGLDFYRFNVKEKPFNNAKIRKAFALAIDRQTIVNKIVQGQQQIALAYVSPGTMTKSGDFRKDDKQAYIKDDDVQSAKKLLKEGMKEEGITKLPKVEILFSQDEKNKKVAEAIQEMWHKHLKAKVTLKAQEAKVFLNNRNRGNFMIARSSFLPDYNDPYNYLESFQTNHPMNQTGWSDKEYDSILNGAYKAKSEARRMELLHRAEKVLMDQMPVIPLYYYNNIVMKKPEVQGVMSHPTGPRDYRFTEIKG
ncbi:oligopeptide transport system substrate-binding protein/dipeptide transport system substrate-binding protein [Marininema mesophilum]|uniref:Oligopeptide transport system substrate-binding protein/dipeptide transport system substrate-binding protein n=1 Tax=Marininema mesophilum TaxID=1048340 RepID=A0A1H2QYI7_9BACL|nr:peptide ABC transporter substrate-binding protein [Marininema mesophilum]SDW12217.1 oligopeptide transport system substrate-binding protein/dipeptide transport system substrate-binding protein [Marininema mesophilum]